MRMVTPLSRVRGLGSARSGARHWWHERVSSVALLLLLVWLAVALLSLPDLGYETMRRWAGEPLNAVPLLLLVLVTFWHAKLGLQVVIEDYVHDDGSKLFWIMLLNFAAILAGATAAFALLRLALTGTA